MSIYLLVTGDFVQTGGMDMANFALAQYLAAQDNEVHLVAHRVATELSSRPNVTVHQVPKPANSYFLAAPLLSQVGRHWAAKVSARGGRVLVNGGNCQWGDINWVHYVHAAYKPHQAGDATRRMKNSLSHQHSLATESSALKKARVVITNSKRTRQDVIERLAISPERVRTIYYGIDRERFRPPTKSERDAAREMLGWPEEKPVVAFVGALGDRRKGFDTLFNAWKMLCADSRWEADLAVIGTGAELPVWTARAKAADLESRIHFLGFRKDVPTVLAGCDALVAPTRYEAYGLGVHEALCCGLPALVTQSAGVAERYPSELQELLVVNPDDPSELAKRLQEWRCKAEETKAVVMSLSDSLRAYTWNKMAEDIVNLIAKIDCGSR